MGRFGTAAGLLLGKLRLVDDLHVGSHVVLAGELLEAVRTGVYFDVALVRRYIMPTEVTDVGIDPRAHLAPVHVVSLFGTEIPYAALGVVDYSVLVRTAATFPSGASTTASTTLRGGRVRVGSRGRRAHDVVRKYVVQLGGVQARQNAGNLQTPGGTHVPARGRDQIIV